MKSRRKPHVLDKVRTGKFAAGGPVRPLWIVWYLDRQGAASGSPTRDLGAFAGDHAAAHRRTLPASADASNLERDTDDQVTNSRRRMYAARMISARGFDTPTRGNSIILTKLNICSEISKERK